MKHWSSTQASVSLSSGEAEFNGVIRGAGQGLGYQALLRDFGVHVPLRVWTDSSVAIGICSRQGLGKLRHLDTHTLWIQQAVRSGRVDLRKVAGTENPADLLTKHSLSRDKLLELTDLYSCRHIEGRAESAPKVRQGSSGRTLVAEADDVATCTVAAESQTHIRPSLNRIGEAPLHHELAGEDVAWMPHCCLDNDALGERFPPMVAPADDHFEDMFNDQSDLVYQHGLEIAQKIADDMACRGRTREDIADRI